MPLPAQDKYDEKMAFLWRSDTLRLYGTFLCLTWWFICPLKGYMAYSRLALPSTSSYRVSAPTVFSFNVSPMSGRKNLPCFDVAAQFEIIMSFQFGRNNRISKMREILGSINIARVASRWFWMTPGPRLKGLYLSKLNGLQFAISGTRGRFTSARSRKTQRDTSALLWISRRITSVYTNCGIINMPPEGWSGNYHNSSFSFNQLSNLTVMIDCLIHFLSCQNILPHVARSILLLMGTAN